MSERRVPAWVFTVEGVRQKKVHVAVDPSAVTAAPERVGAGEVTAFEVIGPDELMIRYGYGACDVVRGIRVHETDQVVVVDVDEEDVGSGEPCPALLKSGTARVRLDRPLGDRLVLDVSTGVPVPRRP